MIRCVVVIVVVDDDDHDHETAPRLVPDNLSIVGSGQSARPGQIWKGRGQRVSALSRR